MSDHKHNFFYATIKADFEPIQFGATPEDTLYKRVEYVVSSCPCGEAARKVRVVPQNTDLDSDGVDTSNRR